TPDLQLSPLAADAHDAVRYPKEVLGCGPAEENDDGRRHQLNLALEKRTARLGFLGRGGAVARRTPVDDVGDVSVALGEPDRGQHSVEQLSRAPDKRLALQILIAPGCLADQHQRRLWPAAIKTQVLGGGLKAAAVEGSKPGAELFEIGSLARG